MSAPLSVPQLPPAYSTYDELLAKQARIEQLPGQLGLIWQLNGPLSTAVEIKAGSNPPQPYCTETGPDPDFAATPLTFPKVSSITVRVTDLENYEDDWYERHSSHSDPDGDHGPDVEWQAFPDWDPEVDEGEMQLVRCCGQLRPRGKNASLVVKPKEEGTGFVTLGDYLEAVHPWLMNLRDDLVAAMSNLYDKPLDRDTELSINSNALDALTVEMEVNRNPAQSATSGAGTQMGHFGQPTNWPSEEEFHARMARLVEADHLANVANVPATSRGV